jgi:hypothetical protein
MGTRAIAIFCEDIREEKSGQITLVGIFPDNLNLPRVPSLAPKLGVYVRVTFDPQSRLPKQISARLQTPWEASRNLQLGNADANLIATAVANSRKNNLPVVGIIMQAMLSPFPIPTAGQIVIYVKVDDEEYPCGVLNLIVPTSTSSNASPPQT